MTGARIEQLTIADDARAWEALGFAVEDDTCRLGDVVLRFAGRDAGRGIVGWTLSGVASAELDGLATETHAGAPAERPIPVHPNGVEAIDHVVVITPALDRTTAVLQAAGLDLRRIREEPTPAGAPRQAFFRLGAEIVEVVQAPDDAIERTGGPDGPAIFWGLALRVADLHAAVAELGEERVSAVRPAVQPGREIASLRRAAGVAVPIALMSPKPQPASPRPPEG